MRGAVPHAKSNARPPGDGHTLKEAQLRGWTAWAASAALRNGMPGKTSGHDAAARRSCIKRCVRGGITKPIG